MLEFTFYTKCKVGEYSLNIVPELRALRKAVDGIPHNRDRLLVKTLYLTASRVSEVAGRNAPSQRKAHGNELTWRLEDYENQKVLVLKVYTCKHKEARFRIIALPLNPKYEPWTKDLATFITGLGELRFNITRQRIWQIIRKRLDFIDSEIHPHSLRHWRLTHLVELYGFDPYDLTVYAGWTFKTGVGQSGQLDTYLHLDWRRYFSKLLKEIK